MPIRPRFRSFSHAAHFCFYHGFSTLFRHAPSAISLSVVFVHCLTLGLALEWSFVASQARYVLPAANAESRCAQVLWRRFPPFEIVQCDQAEPPCAQCITSHRECFGYRDQLDLRFTDETERVKSKVLTRKHGRTSTKNDTVNPQSASPLRALSTLAEGVACCFFVQNYVWPDSDSTRGHLDHIPSLIGASRDEVIMLAITPVGMAGLSNLRNDSHLMTTAKQKVHVCVAFD